MREKPRKITRLTTAQMQKLKKELKHESPWDAMNSNAVFLLERNDWAGIGALVKIGAPLSWPLLELLGEKSKPLRRGRPKKIITDDNKILGAYIWFQVHSFGRSVENVIQDVISDLEKNRPRSVRRRRTLLKAYYEVDEFYRGKLKTVDQ